MRRNYVAFCSTSRASRSSSSSWRTASRNRNESFARTYRFVGLDPDFVPGELHQPRKVARGEPLDLGGELYDAALEIYVEEMKLLAEDWPELDLSRWPSVSDLR